LTMDQATVVFILFGLAAALLINASDSSRWRANALLVASVAFVALLVNDLWALVPLLAFLALGYVSARWVARGVPWGLSVTVGLVIAIYIWLKRYSFLPPASFLSYSYLTLGLSYIFFRVLHLIIESDGNPALRRLTFASYLTYTLNFTTFVSGPIQRYEEFIAQAGNESELHLDAGVIWAQVERIIKGYFKVNVLAPLISMVQVSCQWDITHVMRTSDKFGCALVVASCYPFFLYANFSGYIDIVIAIARLFRFQLPENFDRPFSSRSFIEFWNRWHITLSSWLKSYVYNPLLILLMRRTGSATLAPLLGAFSLFVTFFLVGIWHGRTSEFVVFGLLQGGGVAANRLWQIALARGVGRQRYRAVSNSPSYILFARGLTFAWFSFSLFWFWSNWHDIGLMCQALEPALWLAAWCTVCVLAGAVLTLWEWMRVGLPGPWHAMVNHRYSRVVVAAALLELIFIYTALLDQPAPDIVYKAF
jgi:alginate O-acetyltransferase complex protein AlgI